MTHTTLTEHGLLSSGGDTVSRGLVIGTRPIYLQGTITAVNQDGDTNGIWSLDLTSISGVSTDPTFLLTGMTVEIGTVAGAHDIGTVRFRVNNATSTRLPIAETAPADLPVQVGNFVTVRNEFLPWGIPKRIVYTRVAGVITAVTEYLDYDLGYPGGSNPFPPKANIVAGLNADGTWKEVQRVANEDFPGAGYRTVTLDSAATVIHNPGLSVDAVIWIAGSPGITVVSGSLTTPAIGLQIPVGQVWVHLFISDSFRNDIVHLPLWTLSESYPPLRNFNVTSDETELGREMQFEFFGDVNEADETVIPEKSLVCYFEELTWIDGDTPPESYRTQVMGWVTDDDPLLKLQESKYGIKVGGTQVWKSRFRANSIGLIDTGSTPTTYTEMQNLTVDRAIDFSLRATDTLRSLVNVYYTRVTTEVEALTLPQGDAWTQVTEAVPYAAMSSAGCDSYGNIWLRKLYSFLSDGQRLTVLECIALTNVDWTDADGLDLPTTKINKVGMVVGSAEYWNSGRILYASQAPGLRSGYGVGLPKLPDQYVDPPTPQGDLNRLTGLFYWHENNPRPTVTLILFGNLDVIEPCWNQPILITWADDTIRGTTLTDAPFIVKHVSIQHTNDPDGSTPPKRITLTLEQATSGEDGETAPVLQMEGMSQYADTTCDVTAAFSSSVDVCLVTFTDTSTGDLLYDWLWDFGDGSYSIEQNPVHGYADAGTYTVTLTVSNECGSSDPVSHDVTVSAESIIASFTDVPTGLTVDFTDTSTADGGIAEWAWDFGDGSVSPSQNPSRTYAAAGTYTVTLVITSGCGNTATVSHDVTVPPENLESEFWKVSTGSLAIFYNDGALQTCAGDFSNATPSWTLTGLGTTRSLKFVPDFNSGLFVGSGSQVDGWIIGGSTASAVPNIYRIVDIGGANTITTVYSPPAFPDPAENLGITDIISTPGYPPIAVGWYSYDAHHGELVYFTLTTTDGISWTLNDFTGPQTDNTLNAGTHLPFRIYQSPNDGTVYVGYGLQLAGGTVIAASGVHVSTDGGVTFDNASVVQATTGDVLALQLPVLDETQLYDTDVTVLEDNGSDISPQYSAIKHYAGTNQALAIDGGNPLVLAVVGTPQSGGAARHCFGSTDGGGSWAAIGADGDYTSITYNLVKIAADDNTQSIWGGQDTTNHAVLRIYNGSAWATTKGGLRSGSAAAARIVGIVRLD